MLEFLEQLETNPALYRFVVLLVMTVVVNISGYFGNRVVNTKESYNGRKFVETLMFYTPLIALLPEVLPMEYAIAGSLALDIFVRTIAHLKGEEPKAV